MALALAPLLAGRDPSSACCLHSFLLSSAAFGAQEGVPGLEPGQGAAAGTPLDPAATHLPAAAMEALAMVQRAWLRQQVEGLVRSRLHA